LRVKDLDFGAREITIRGGRGRRDRVTMLPEALRERLQDRLETLREQDQADPRAGSAARGRRGSYGRGSLQAVGNTEPRASASGYIVRRRRVCHGLLGRAPLPDAAFRRMRRKYPNADREWGWQWVFPAASHYLDRHTGMQHRHHVHESVIQKAVHEASRRAGLTKAVTPPSFRCSLATHLPEDGYDIRTVQGVAWSSRREDDDDLHPRVEPWGPGSAQSPRSAAEAGEGREAGCCAGRAGRHNAPETKWRNGPEVLEETASCQPRMRRHVFTIDRRAGYQADRSKS
jgi:hypothetical protein